MTCDPSNVQGFRYTLRAVYAHFPININIEGKVVEVRNFVGERRVRRVTVRGDTVAKKNPKVKDQIELEGNSIEDVSQSAADIQQSCLVRNKDIRKFLDGVYISESGPIEAEE